VLQIFSSESSPRQPKSPGSPLTQALILFWAPAPQEALHGCQSNHSPQKGQAWTLQVRSSLTGPSQPMSPACPLMHCLVWVWVPLPQVTVQADHMDQVEKNGQAWVLQALFSKDSPKQPSSPCLPLTHSRDLCMFPPPHVLEHTLQSFQLSQNGHGACSAQSANSTEAPRQPRSPGCPFKHLLSCFLIPFPQVLSHDDQSDHNPHIGHAPSLQVSVAMASPSHPGSPGLPPLQALVLVCIPTPQDSEQAEKAVQALHEAQIAVLQTLSSVLLPLHPASPGSPPTQALDLCSNPAPHVAVHDPHSLHNPHAGQLRELQASANSVGP